MNLYNDINYIAFSLHILTVMVIGRPRTSGSAASGSRFFTRTSSDALISDLADANVSGRLIINLFSNSIDIKPVNYKEIYYYTGNKNIKVRECPHPRPS